MNIFNQIIKPGYLCYDIGANNGNKAVEMLAFGAKVICVEPQNECVNNLLNKFRGNKNVIIVNKAAGDMIGKSKIFISSSNTLSTMSESFIKEVKKERFSTSSWNEVQDIEVTTLDTLIDTYGIPDFCKIDVEGFELEVLSGLTKPIPIISIEFTPELKEKTFECIKLINNIGKYKYNYSEGESHTFSFGEWVESGEMIDFLYKNNDFSISFGDVYAKLI